VSLPNPFPLQDLLPESTDSFYRYSGSLTTPECQESVTWTVFDTPITISPHQVLHNLICDVDIIFTLLLTVAQVPAFAE